MQWYRYYFGDLCFILKGEVAQKKVMAALKFLQATRCLPTNLVKQKGNE